MTRPRHDMSGGQAAGLEHLDPVSLAAALGKLPPTHALVTAARVGTEVADARAEYQAAVRDAGKDVAAAAERGLRGWDNGRGWVNSRVPHDEVARRRAEPGTVPAPAQVDAELAAAFAVAGAACAAAVAVGDGDEDEAGDDEPGDRAGDVSSAADVDTDEP